MGSYGGGSEPPPQSPPGRQNVMSSSRGIWSEAPEELGFGVFWGVKKSVFSTVHYSPVIVLIPLA